MNQQYLGLKTAVVVALVLFATWGSSAAADTNGRQSGVDRQTQGVLATNLVDFVDKEFLRGSIINSVPMPSSPRTEVDISEDLARDIALIRAEYYWDDDYVVMAVIPIWDVLGKLVAWDVDLCRADYVARSYEEVAMDWRLALTEMYAHQPQVRHEKGTMDNGEPEEQLATHPFATISISATYDIHPVRTAQQALSNYHASGWVAQEIASEVLGITPELLTVQYDGPWVRSYRFSAGGRSIVVQGYEPWSWYEAEEYVAAVEKAIVFGMKEVSLALEEKGRNFQDELETMRTANKEHVYSLLEATSTSRATTYIPGYISDFERYEWHYGCSPTAAAMVMNYWEERSWFGKLNSWYFKEWDYINSGWDCHIPTLQQQLAITMGTWANGWTLPTNIYPGMQNHAINCGYPWAGGYRWIGGWWDWQWDNITDAIDEGKPFVFNVDCYPMPGGGTAPHSVAAVGYDDVTNEVMVYTTWSGNGNTVQRVRHGFEVWVNTSGDAPYPYGSVQADVKLIHPDGGQAWSGCGYSGGHCCGDNLRITWTNRGEPQDHVRLDYSTNSGVTWSHIVYETPDDGAYNWTIPDGIDSDNCRIRIQQHSTSNTLLSSDGSYGDFRISPGPAPGTPSISGLPSSVCWANTYNLSASASGVVTNWFWKSTCGGTFNNPWLQSPIWTPPVGYVGDCVIEAYAFNASCVAIRAKSVMVLNVAPGIPSISGFPYGSPSTVCTGCTYNLSASASGVVTNWLWTSTCGGTFDSPNIQSPTWTAPCGYTGQCFVYAEAANGCGARNGFKNLLLIPGTLNITGLLTLVCGGNSFSLSVSCPGDFTSFQWTSSCGTFDSEQSQTPIWTAPFGYTGDCVIYLEVEGSSGGAIDSASTVVKQLPSAPAYVSPPDGATDLSQPVNLVWTSGSPGPTGIYQVQVDDNSNFSSPVIDAQSWSTNYSASGLADNTRYYWRVRGSSVFCGGHGNWNSGTFDFTTGVTSVEEIDGPELPERFALSQNYPNPFNPETRIEFDLPHRSFVTIDVYDIMGRQIRNLAREWLSAGRKAVTWDGRDDDGQLVSSGIYIYRIVTDGFVESKKMVLLK